MYKPENLLTIIIPTTGAPEALRAIESALSQSVPVDVMVVLDGSDIAEFPSINRNKFNKDSALWYIVLPYNTGKGEDGKVKYYGHRIYAGVPNFVNTKYVSFLDEDNWLEPNFAEVMLKAADEIYAKTYTCQRIVYSSDGKKIGIDIFESIPENFADMNTYMVDTNFFCKQLSSELAFGQWGADRFLSKETQKYSRCDVPIALVNYVSPARLDNFFMENIK